MGRRKWFSRGEVALATSAIIGLGIAGCGNSIDPKADPIVNDPSGSGGGSPTAGGSGGDTGSTQGLQPGATIFSANYGDEGEQGLAGLAVDAKGNVYVAG